jgi:hypothetical protein
MHTAMTAADTLIDRWNMIGIALHQRSARNLNTLLDDYAADVCLCHVKHGFGIGFVHARAQKQPQQSERAASISRFRAFSSAAPISRP